MSRNLLTFSLILFSLAAPGASLRAEEGYHVDESLRRAVESRRYFNPDAPKPAQDPNRRRWKKAWIVSWIGFAAATALDAHSSRGKVETNPFLRNSQGRFSTTKAAGLKSAVGAGLFALQWRTIKRNPHKNYYKGFTFVTGAAAGAMGAVAAHNYGVDRAR